MPEKRRKFDQVFREGALQIVRETGRPGNPGNRSRGSLVISGSTRARWATGMPRIAGE
jgi:hypothetical protein